MEEEGERMRRVGVEHAGAEWESDVLERERGGNGRLSQNSLLARSKL